MMITLLTLLRKIDKNSFSFDNYGVDIIIDSIKTTDDYIRVMVTEG